MIPLQEAWGFDTSFVRVDPLEANWVCVLFVPVPPLQWSTPTPPCPTNTLFPFHGQF